MSTQTTATSKLYIGLDIHKKSWSVHFRTDIFDHRGFNMPPNPGKLSEYVSSQSIRVFRCRNNLIMLTGAKPFFNGWNTCSGLISLQPIAFTASFAYWQYCILNTFNVQTNCVVIAEKIIKKITTY